MISTRTDRRVFGLLATLCCLLSWRAAAGQPAPAGREPPAGPPPRGTADGETAGEDASGGDPAPAVPEDAATGDAPRRLGPFRELDAVELTDGTVQHGLVSDLGGNSIEIELRGARRRILKRDIQSIRFYQDRQGAERLETDLLVLKLNDHQVRCKILKESGEEIQVELPGGAKTTYKRNQVLRVLYRDQVLSAASKLYNRDLAGDIERAVGVLESGDEEAARQAERFLVECGVFALEHVQRARRELEGAAGGDGFHGVEALDRILHIHELKKAVTKEMELEESEIYADLAYGSVELKESLLKVIFARFAEDCVPLARCLIKYPREDPHIRAFAIEILRRFHHDRALVSLYNETTGELQFAAAVALARNRIYLGIPTLIEALELGGEAETQLRDVALRVLVEATGQDFGFRADGAPAARDRAIAKWKAWWSENEEHLRGESMLVLEKRRIETLERKQCEDLWKKGHELWAEGKVAQAQVYFQEARGTDPSFYKAQLSLAVLLHSELDRLVASEDERKERLAEARQILESLARRPLPEMKDSDQHWVHHELANVYRLEGRPADALEAYETSLSFDSSSISAMIGAASCRWELSTGQNDLTSGERRLEQIAALKGFQDAQRLISERLRTVQVLAVDDLPNLETLPFARRDFNRSALEVRSDLEEKEIRLFLRIARVHRLHGNGEQAVLALQEGIDTLRASFDAKNKKALEAELRSMLGSTYEELGKDLLALEQYRTVVDRLDSTSELCRRGIERVKRRLESRRTVSQAE